MPHSPRTQQQLRIKTIKRSIFNIGSEKILEIANSETRMALNQLKNNNCAGEDTIIVEMLKISGRKTVHILKILFYKIFDEEKIPQDWYDSETILICEKGDNTNIENYRPIFSVSQLYNPSNRLNSENALEPQISYTP
ncbi:unnamed protein product [Ceutorhynchus assimilis]|uniref:Uncharacterized protein n=1 Tax=Ceutorhynchus assimilis TaxID=467358 RepID=A0A9N9QRT9_9CUCU|nr:unnamed protein product [Ceutorhynchus assimilis]